MGEISLIQKQQNFFVSALHKPFLRGYSQPVSCSIKTSAADVYFGTSRRYFPNRPDLQPDQYLNITEDVNSFVQNAIMQVEKEKNKNRFFRWFSIIGLFARNFPVGAVWDTNCNPLFPGREKNGDSQYAFYKRKIVSASYVGNNVFGQICAAAGLPLWFTKLSAHLDSCGVVEIFTKWKFPSFKQLKQLDSAHSQQAIESGYNDYFYKDPWLNPSLDPKRPYPKK